MRFGSKRQKPTLGMRRSGASTHVKAPVLRYYKPATVEKRSTPLTRGEDIERTRPSGSKKLRRFMLRWGGFALIAFIVFINFTISHPVVKFIGRSDVYQSQDAYRLGVSEIFKESWTHRGKLTVRTAEFEQQIRNRFPEVDRATVVVPLVGRQLQVGLTFVEPLGRLQASGGQQGVIGMNGTLLTLESSQEINARYASLPLITLPNMTFEKGQRLLTTDEVQLLSLLIAELDGSDSYRHLLKSIEYDIKKRDVLVRFSDVSYYAKLTPERTSRDQVGALVATLRFTSEQGTAPQEYIDVRVEDRVFVK